MTGSDADLNAVVTQFGHEVSGPEMSYCTWCGEETERWPEKNEKGYVLWPCPNVEDHPDWVRGKHRVEGQ